MAKKVGGTKVGNIIRKVTGGDAQIGGVYKTPQEESKSTGGFVSTNNPNVPEVYNPPPKTAPPKTGSGGSSGGSGSGGSSSLTNQTPGATTGMTEINGKLVTTTKSGSSTIADQLKKFDTTTEAGRQAKEQYNLSRGLDKFGRSKEDYRQIQLQMKANEVARKQQELYQNLYDKKKISFEDANTGLKTALFAYSKDVQQRELERQGIKKVYDKPMQDYYDPLKGSLVQQSITPEFAQSKGYVKVDVIGESVGGGKIFKRDELVTSEGLQNGKGTKSDRFGITSSGTPLSFFSPLEPNTYYATGNESETKSRVFNRLDTGSSRNGLFGLSGNKISGSAVQEVEQIEINPITGKPYGTVEKYEYPKGLEGWQQKLKQKGNVFYGAEKDRPLYGIGASLLSLPILAKNLVTKPIQTGKGIAIGVYDFGERILTGKGFPEVGRTIQESPGYTLGYLGGELASGYGASKVVSITGKTVTKTTTKLSPKYRPVTGKVIKDIPSEFGGTIDIPIVKSSVKAIGEPLSKQVLLSGQEINAVSASRDLFGIVKREVKVNKPITTSKGELERSFFADPRGRLRGSRLGAEDETASISDILSGNAELTFKKEKAQAILFERTRVEEFPLGLKDIESSLKKGKPLTPSQEIRLLKFQMTPSGKFKPVGFLTREPEVTLAPGEIIYKKKNSAVTLINGKRVPIVRTGIKQASTETQNLLSKLNTGRISETELTKLNKLLRKESGFSYYENVPKKYVNPYSTSIKGLSIFGRTSYNYPKGKQVSYNLYGTSKTILYKDYKISKDIRKRNIDYITGGSGGYPKSTYQNKPYGNLPPIVPYYPPTTKEEERRRKKFGVRKATQKRDIVSPLIKGYERYQASFTSSALGITATKAEVKRLKKAGVLGGLSLRPVIRG